MALKLTLKPHERAIISGAVISNGDASSSLIIENKVPILREKDIMSERGADTPCKRIYLIIQLMYVDEKNIAGHHKRYWELVRELVNAAPSTLIFIDRISSHILSGRHYQALKACRKLIDYEQEVMKHACKTT